MLNIVWGIMILLGLVFGIVSGNGGKIVDSMINGCGEAVTLSITLAGGYMLWMGFMEVAKDLGAIDKLAKLIYPFMKKLFPSEREAIAPITLNIAANFFGMGGAATPFGIDAMEKMQLSNTNKKTATNNMCMFIALNASALELLPTGVLALRTAAASANPYAIVAPTALASIASFAAAIILAKMFERLY